MYRRRMKSVCGLALFAILLGGCSKSDDDSPTQGTVTGFSLDQTAENLATSAPKLNAQNIASAASAARAAGYSEVWFTKDDAVADVVRGIRVQVGSQEVSFKAGPAGTADQQEAMRFLIFDETTPGNLRYSTEAQ